MNAALLEDARQAFDWATTQGVDRDEATTIRVWVWHQRAPDGAVDPVGIGATPVDARNDAVRSVIEAWACDDSGDRLPVHDLVAAAIDGFAVEVAGSFAAVVHVVERTLGATSLSRLLGATRITPRAG